MVHRQQAFGAFRSLGRVHAVGRERCPIFSIEKMKGSDITLLPSRFRENCPGIKILPTTSVALSRAYPPSPSRPPESGPDGRGWPARAQRCPLDATPRHAPFVGRILFCSSCQFSAEPHRALLACALGPGGQAEAIFGKHGGRPMYGS